MMTDTFTPCILVPFYNHGQFSQQLIARLLPHKLPIVIVDDGSDAMHKSQLKQAISRHEAITLVTLAENGGKGSAVIAGFRRAYALGFSHALQVDADCQHDFSVIPQFIAQAKKQPDALVCGYPIYDDSVPKSRLYPRYITHFWVSVHTLSRSIKDSMCGFRAYPLPQTVTMLAKTSMGLRMDFDIEIAVKLYWSGLAIINLPVKVIYHREASSHFRLWADNVLITKAHTLMFFGMLKRVPTLLKRHFRQV